MQLVLADGSTIEAGVHSIEEVTSDSPPTARRQALVRDVATVIQREQAVIDQYAPKTLVDRAGYRCARSVARRAFESGSFDFRFGRHVGIDYGSHGTHSSIAASCLGVVLFFFDRLESAARGALEIAGMEASACDMMDRRLLSIARDADVRYDLLIPRDAEAMLLGGGAGRDAGRSAAAIAGSGGTHPAPQKTGI